MLYGEGGNDLLNVQQIYELIQHICLSACPTKLAKFPFIIHLHITDTNDFYELNMKEPPFHIKKEITMQPACTIYAQEQHFLDLIHKRRGIIKSILSVLI